MVNDSLANGASYRQAQWTESIAAGSISFLEGIKDKLGILTKGRRIIENDSELQLREETGIYNTVFDGKKENIEPLNAYFGDVIH